MKKLNILFALSLISFFSYGQDDNYCGWEYTVTANNAVIAIQEANFENIYITGTEMNSSIVDIECPMWIGVFYLNDNGEYTCGGYTEWDSSQNMAIAAWGDDSTTNEQDGFIDGQSYIFGLCVDGFGDFYGAPEMSVETPFSDTYNTNGFGSINSVYFGPPVNSLSSLISSCWPINLLDNNKSKALIKIIDIYGRELQEKNPKGFYFEIYDDKSIVRNLGF